MQISRLSAGEAEQLIPALSELLQDAVAGGASIGFAAPLSETDAHAYWHSVVAKLDSPSHHLFVAREDERTIGTVQLGFPSFPNASHRAEVLKLLVHRSARGRGIATALLATIEAAARHANKSLLVLDTLTGDAAERLYTRLGYQLAGIIPGYARGTLDPNVYPCSFMYKHLRGEDA